MISDDKDAPPIIPLASILNKQELLDGLSSISRKQAAFSSIMQNLLAEEFAPGFKKRFTRRWRISQAADMVGRSVQSIRRKEAAGDLPEPDKDDKGRRQGYSLEDINLMRDVFGTRPGRKPGVEPAVISFSNFKGGAGKSTLSINCSQYLALKGLKILIVDADPQGSMSTVYGASLDLNKLLVDQGLLSPDDVPMMGLEHFLGGDTDDFSQCVHPSYFPGIDICPSGQDLANVEYALAREWFDDSAVLGYVRDGIRDVYSNYDVVIFDPPPALSFLSLSILTAANGLVIPMRPTLYDFASTMIFFTMFVGQLTTLIQSGLPVNFYFETIAINHMSKNKGAHADIANAMRHSLSVDDFYPSPVYDSAELDSAAKEIKTFYDLSGPISSYKVHNDCKESLDGLFSEIEQSIYRLWDTHSKVLRQPDVPVSPSSLDGLDSSILGTRSN